MFRQQSKYLKTLFLNFKNSNIINNNNNNNNNNILKSSKFTTTTSTINNNNNNNNNNNKKNNNNEIIEIEELRNKINRYNDLYYNKSKSEISDFEYDKLFKRLEILEKKFNQQTITNQVGAPISDYSNNRGLKFRHKSRMLSLQNTYSKDDIIAFKNKIEKFLLKKQTSQQQQPQQQIEYSLELKYDGIGISLVYENNKLKRVLTRGNGEIGEDITTNALQFIPSLKNLLTLPSNLTVFILFLILKYKDFEIRGEVVLNKSYLKIINKLKLDNNDQHQYKNTRNIVSGILRKSIEEDANDSLNIEPILLLNEQMKFDFFPYFFIPTNNNNNNINNGENENENDNEKENDNEMIIDDERCNTQSKNLKLFEKMGFQIDNGSNTVVTLSTGGGGNNNDIKNIEEFIKEWELKKRENHNWDIDGIVIKVNDINIQRILGDINRSPRWAFAYKFGAKSEISTIKDIVLQVGKSGRITPVALVEPIQVHGVTISRATLNNLSYINKLNIKIGSKVLIERAGDVIPKIITNLDDNINNTNTNTNTNNTNNIESLFKCNENGNILCPCNLKSELVNRVGYVDYFCVAENCPNQLVQQISWFVDKKAMNIQGVGKSQIQVLLENQLIEDFGDLYELYQFKEKLLSLKGFSHTKVNNLLESIEDSKSRGLASLLCAIGIPGIGSSNSKILSEKFQSLDNLINSPSIESIELQSGLGRQTSESIFNFFNPLDQFEKQYLDYLIFKFKSNNLKLTHNNNNDNNEEIGNNNNNNNNENNNSFLSNKYIVITGKFKLGDRDFVKDFIQRKFNAKVQSSINSFTQILLIGEKPAIAKLNKANELGIQIKSENELDIKH
ncbi:BRCT domain-containing protein [Dictyostelium discoideum AX4]|uniref:DNA ligase (NAD(+)) n=1 Tax=Dictyostelium discoideum TaxID=44689 RepID=Q1ZXG5_DICDI|nr:BRCT domain-containing protein [Dictyostelium discoideum AX4]EAS66865.1 BRCT domain-containing protein [Dictyostelium discoideum AX4]|eukprot:XP_001134548.1 BRCT domain-containing protein [Dictyostelium discoideum AX4]